MASKAVGVMAMRIMRRRYGAARAAAKGPGESYSEVIVRLAKG